VKKLNSKLFLGSTILNSMIRTSVGHFSEREHVVG
jgi:hypothetical protein